MAFQISFHLWLCLYCRFRLCDLGPKTDTWSRRQRQQTKLLSENITRETITYILNNIASCGSLEFLADQTRKRVGFSAHIYDKSSRSKLVSISWTWHQRLRNCVIRSVFLCADMFSILHLFWHIAELSLYGNVVVFRYSYSNHFNIFQ